jgi:hypothetical protein
MRAGEHAGVSVGESARSARLRPGRPWRWNALSGGGTDGNEQLTNLTGLVLLVMLAVLGVTIVRIGQLIWLHLFLGLVLIGPVVVKMGSTGYRFVRYYTRDPAYREKGPPEVILRAIAPLVVITTVVVFVSGVLLLFGGPSSKDSYLALHKVSFFVWLAFMGLHVLSHLPSMGRTLMSGIEHAKGSGISAGAAGRWITIASGVVGGLVLAVVLISHFGVWTTAGALHGHHHGG